MIAYRERGSERSAPADAARVRALWEQLETLGFWDRRPGGHGPRGLLRWLIPGPVVMDAMETTITATTVVDGRQRRAGLSLPARPGGDNASRILQLIDRFFAGEDLAT